MLHRFEIHPALKLSRTAILYAAASHAASRHRVADRWQ